jgi:predicted RNase H-like HicB family nuclease
MENLQLKGEKNFGKTRVKVNVQVILFQEDDIWYAYLPALDINGYGSNEEEAKESLKIAINEFIRYTLNKKTFYDELKRLGWIIKKSKKTLIAPKISDLVNENEDLKEILDSKRYISDGYQVRVPVLA